MRWVLEHKRAALALVVVALVAAGYGARRLQLRFTFRDFYDYPGNAAVPLLDRYEKEFGDPAGSVDLLVMSQDAFQPAVIAYLAELTHAMEAEPLFSRVDSLANASVAGGARMVPLFTKFPPPREQMALARARAEASPRLVRHLVSEQGSLTLVRAQLAALSPSLEEEKAAVAAARRVLDAHPPPPVASAHVVGTPVIAVAMTEPLLRDQVVFMGAAVALILLALVLCFRSLLGVIVPLLTVLTALVWTAGVFPFLGRPLDMISSVIPATLMVYGAVDPIFVISRFLQQLERGLTRREAIVAAYAELLLPCFLSSLTTACGFFAFAVLDLPILRAFGITIGIGVCFAFITTVTVLPLLLDTLPAPRAAPARPRLHHLIERTLTQLWEHTRKRRALLLAVLVAFAIAAAFYGRAQNISVSYANLLPARESGFLLHYVERHLDGHGREAVLIEGEPGAAERPEALRAMAAIAAAARANPMVTSATAITDALAELTPSPANSEALSALTPAVRRDYVNEDGSRAQIAIRFMDRGSAAWRAFQVELEQATAQALVGLPLHASFTGFTATLFPVLDHAVEEMLTGFVLSFCIVVLLQWLVLRSFRVALISIGPNLIPVLTCFVVLRALGISLRIGSVLFLCVSIGGLFNTTIQLSAQVLRRMRAGRRDGDAVIAESLRVVAPPAVFTAGILSLGFAIFIGSRFPDLQIFGVLSLTTMLVGVAADLVVTPLLLRWLLPRD